MKKKAIYQNSNFSDKLHSYVQDIAPQYYSSGKISFSDFLSNKMLIVMTIRQGIPYDLFNSIKDMMPFSLKEWAEFLNLSDKSLQRYRNSKQKFKPIYTEKIIEMAEVSYMALEVFGSMEKFKLWLDTPNYALGNMKPYELLKDSYGKEMIMGELTRINYGILA